MVAVRILWIKITPAMNGYTYWYVELWLFIIMCPPTYTHTHTMVQWEQTTQCKEAWDPSPNSSLWTFSVSPSIKTLAVTNQGPCDILTTGVVFKSVLGKKKKKRNSLNQCWEKKTV